MTTPIKNNIEARNLFYVLFLFIFDAMKSATKAKNIMVGMVY